MVFTDEVDRGIDVIIWKVIVIPEKVEQLVKKLEKHEDDIESPWGLSTWLQHKPQKAEREKYKLPTPKEEEELDAYEKKLSDKVQGKAEEDRHGPLAPPREEVHLPTPKEEHDVKHFRKQLTGKVKGLGIPKKAEEESQIKWTPKSPKPKPVEPLKQSPKDEIESFLHLHQKACEECDDPLVFPDEYKMGMKEEQEHADVTGNDKEATKKIVLAHLAEDPHYYTKLGTVMKAEEEVQKDTRLPKKLTKGLSLGDKGIMRQSRKFEDKIGMTSPEKTMVRQKKNLPPMKAEEGERPAGPIDVSKGAPPGFEKKKDWGIPKKAEEEERRQSPLRRSMKGVPHEKDVIRHLQVIDPVKKAEEASPKEQMKSTPGYIKQQQKEIERVRSTKKAEEVDNDSLNELYMFMKWLIDNGHTPDKDKNFAKLMNQYEVEKFSSEQEKQSDSDKLGEMEKPARFKAEPKDGV